ncbi:vacuolar sorting protein 3 isoform X2 [Magnolia sinica]|uniref:vacuolar sorting protein 3 isoform X2 n=1 Tax=Magnolia sinica TaxID=86752 RepID=UPI00265A5247|nr:vacuolar sorting protein 3 isoform X2 [Magnolia sinica]
MILAHHPMAKPHPKDRTVLEPFAEFDPSKTSPLSSPSLSISAISLSSQNLIHVGTKDGKLILLSSNTSTLPNPNQDSISTVGPLRSLSITDRPIDSIHTFGEIDRVLILSDGALFLVDSLLLQPVRKLNLPKGVLAVAKRLCHADSASLDWAVDGGSSIQRSQRLLQKLGGGIWVNGTKSRASELQRNGNSVAAVAAVGKKLILIEVDAGGSSVILKEIQGIDGVKTMVWLDESIIVGTVNGYALFFSSTGQGNLIFSLPESSGLPCLKSLWRDKQAILLVDNVGIVVSDQGQPVGGSLAFRHAPDSVGEVGPHVIVVKDGKMDLYHKRMGVHVQSVLFAGEGVGRCVVAVEESGIGDIVVVATPSKVICFRKVSVEEQIKDLLRKKNFKEAIHLVEELECEGEMTKEMLSFVHAQVGFLLLFDLHFEDAVNHFLQSETMQPSEIFPFIMRDPNRWSQLVPRNRYWGLHPPPVPLEDVVDDGLMAIQRAIFLRKAGVDTVADEDFLLNPPSRADLLESAIQNIIRYLQVSRDKDLNSSVKEGVDTLLMYLYRALNHIDEMEQLASSPNSCVVEELETLLDDSGHLRTLAFLYASKGMSSKALAIWRILARNYSAGLWKDPTAERDSRDNCTSLISGQMIAAIEASKLLEEISDQDIVLQHLGWIADIDQELAVRVLTSEKRANQLSPEEVLAAIDSKKVEIHQRYLQWLIDDQDSDDIRFHTLYALSLAKSAIDAVEMESLSQNPNALKLAEANISDFESRIISRNPVRERLQLFLQSSDLYDPEEVLYLIEGSELWLEKAILYRKLGQETSVLQILALKLEDSDAAEQYCVEIGRQDAYMQLLDMYLDPQDGKEPMFKAAVRLLHKHGESLDPLQVLETLSPDMPLQLASDTLLRMLRARVHHHRHGQCFRRLGESTSVSGRDFKRDIIFKPGWLVNRQT